MHNKRFGPTGVDVPVMGQGTWDMPESGARKTEAMRAIRRGIELGMTHLDTAEMYGSGGVERTAAARRLPASRPRRGCLSPAKSYRATRAIAARSKHAIAACAIWGWTIWTCIYSIGPAVSRWKRRCVPWLIWYMRGKRASSASAISKPTRCSRRAICSASVPLACNQVLYHLRSAASNTRLSRPLAARHRDRCLYAVRPRVVQTFE